MISTYYTNLYLRITQAAYAIIAFPIGTCLSIAPIFLHLQKGVPIRTVGLLMACGELLGIFAMKAAEVSKKGFIVGRPHDLHLINFCLAVSLVLIPVFPTSTWYLSAVAMILVQAFNSSSKPVVGESLYRLGVMTQSNPNKVFALANMWRRIGNATIGASTPLVYSLEPDLSFYAIGTIMMVFLVIMMGTAGRIQGAFEEFQAEDESPKKNDQESTKRKSIISNLYRFILMENDKNRLSLRSKENIVYDHEDKAKDVYKKEGKESQSISGLDHFLIVHAFSFWDAAISRLPFAFLTIAISSSNKLWVASVILFAYQMGRAISQSIQVWRCTPFVGYILNGLALITYIVLVTYLTFNPEGELWYIPFAFAGLAETLPIQQYYLVRLYNSFDDEDDMKVRHAVKASHTGTGVGSMAAFVVTSQIYSRFGLKAVSYFGLSVQIAKILTNIAIDMRCSRKSSGEVHDVELQ